MNCPKCNATLPDQAKFCLECGAATGMSGASGQEADVSLGGLPTMAAGAPRDVAGAAEISIGGMLTMATAPAAQTSAGQVLAERYELLEEIGRGGFATVWKARDRKLDRVVAVKRLLPTAVEGPLGRQTLERFAREAAAIAQLSHRNIVQVFDHDTDGGGRYVVMEYIAGGSLRDRLKAQGGKLLVEEAVELVKGIARGLAYAHRKNLVHRDIKPANILLDFSDTLSSAISASPRGALPTPKIVDFGLARAGGESEVSVSGFGMGTPWYMPPEQRRNAKGVNHTADIYALGKTLYELVSGETPDNVDSEKVPPFLAKIILKCCKSNPEERFFSCDELLAALEEGGIGCSVLGIGRSGRVPQGSRSLSPNTEYPIPNTDNVCPACGAANAPDVKFCESCGAGMTRLCPECERENSVHKQFCGGCGTEVEGFLKWQEALARMEKAAGEKRWSRVIKEAELLDETPVRLPGKKGHALQAQATTRRSQAATTLKTIEQLRSELGDQLETGNFTAADETLKRLLERDPHDSALTALAEKIKQVLVLERQGDEAVAVADRPAAQAVVMELAAIEGLDAGAKIVMDAIEQRLEQYATAMAEAATAEDAHRFAEAAQAAGTALDVAPRSVEAERLRQDCQSCERRLHEHVQEAERLLHNDNAKALAACRAALAIVPGHAQAVELEKLAQDAMETAAGLRRQALEALERRRPDEANTLWHQAETLDANGGNRADGARIAAVFEKLSISLADAHEALKTKQVGKAESLARRALDVQRDCAAAQAILADCSHIRARRKRSAVVATVVALLAIGAAMVVVRKVEAVAEARAALKAEADRLTAEQWAREEQTRQARVAAVVATAKEAKAAGQWQVCLNKASEALELDTGGRASGTGGRASGTGGRASPRAAVVAEATALKTEAEQALKPKVPNPGDTQTVDLGGGVELELVWCPAGSFTMGSPPTELGRYDDETQHRVTLTKGFWLGKYEVTQAQWEAVMGDNPSYFKNAGRSAPVESVSWDDCQEFVRKLNLELAARGDARPPSGGGFRLPTEAEWEYACRAGTASALNNGKELTSTTGQCRNLDGVAWYNADSDSKIHPVGQKQANAWGLYDMHGNVWEWCSDRYGAYPSGNVTDPIGPGSGSDRVYRGGGWSDCARFCRSADRGGNGPGGRGDILGLRLARSPQ